MENRQQHMAQVSTAAFAAKFQSKRGKYRSEPLDSTLEDGDHHQGEEIHGLPASDTSPSLDWSFGLMAFQFLISFSIIEVYRFLSSEVRAYLPSYETVTIWHLRDLAMGVKRIINCDDVKVINVPQFEGLTIQDIF